MASPTREQIHAAVLAFLQARLLKAAGGPFTTVTRILKTFSDTRDTERPALQIAASRELRKLGYGQRPSALVISLDLYIYATVPKGTPPMSILNPLLDALDAAIDPGPVIETQRLVDADGRPLVDHLWIEGEGQIFEGTLGADAVAIVPLEVLVAST